MSNPKTFVLHGDDAQNFVDSILLQSPLHRFLFRPPAQIMGYRWYRCRFSNGAKEIADFAIIAPDNSGLTTWPQKNDGRGFLAFYGASSRHIAQIFAEHNSKAR